MRANLVVRLAIAVSALLAVAAQPVPTFGAIPPPGTTVTYAVGTGQTFVVPSGITEITVIAYGAEGGTGEPNGRGGGRGAGVRAPSLAVTEGETLQVNVGGMGGHQFSAGGPGGINGGGQGGRNSFGDAGGGGGGASDIRRTPFGVGNRLVVAGGGGGGPGTQWNNAGNGGNGGQNGSRGANGNLGVGGGFQGGSPGNGAGGNGRNGDPNEDPVGYPGPAGGNGSAGQGGTGGGPVTGGTYAAGGGGGGGVTGGGGGGANGDLHDALALNPSQAPGSGGGGGGNSTGPAGTLYEDGVRSGDGLVSILYGDNNGPAVTLTSPTDGSSTSDNTPTFSGLRGQDPNDLPDVTVNVYDSGDNLIQVRQAPSGGAGYSVDAFTLSDGTYRAQAESKDLSDNTGLSPSVTFTVDTLGPFVLIETPVDGSRTDDQTPTVGGQAGTDAGDSDVTVKLYDGSSATGSPLQTLTAAPDGSGAWTVDLTQLSDDVYTAQATQDDSTGNTGTSLEATFTVDTSGPVVTIVSQPKRKTTKKTATFTFSSEAGADFECKLDDLPPADCDSGVTYTGLKRGIHTFTVFGTDATGNDGAPVTVTWKIVRRR